MRKFDPIDIFFIAIISAYFITLICIGITFLCIAFSKRRKRAISPLEEKEILLKDIFSSKTNKKKQKNKIEKRRNNKK